jgi:hypothetical protein
MKRRIFHALIEMAFIIFLFYSNLLMGAYTRGNITRHHSFLWSLGSIFTVQNALIALISSFIGYIVFEYLRRML